MARVLEPLLWRRFPHTQAVAGALEAVDIDLDLAANEGIQILGLDFIIPTQILAAAALVDFEGVVVARPDAQDSISNMPEANSDSDFVAGYHVNTGFTTSGAIFVTHERDWRAPGPTGLVIARRMTYLLDANQAAGQMHLTVWYKRLIFSNDEMLGLIIRRR